MARQIRGIFNASDAIEAQRLLNAALKDWQVSHPQLAAWAEKNLAEGFAVFDLPEAHRVRMRTSGAPRAPSPGSCKLQSCHNGGEPPVWLSGQHRSVAQRGAERGLQVIRKVTLDKATSFL